MDLEKHAHARSRVGRGLSTSYGIVSRASGRIDLNAAPGLGATFRVTLPGGVLLAPEAPVVGAFAPAIRSHGESILLVEDQAPLRKLAARGLTMEGYRVYEADDGISALALLSTLPIVPDLLVTDVVMPRMHGAELARRIQLRHPEMPVLFITGYDRLALANRIGPDAAQVLYKPFTIANLCARVREALDKYRSALAASA